MNRRLQVWAYFIATYLLVLGCSGPSNQATIPTREEMMAARGQSFPPQAAQSAADAGGTQEAAAAAPVGGPAAQGPGGQGPGAQRGAPGPGGNQQPGQNTTVEKPARPQLRLEPQPIDPSEVAAIGERLENAVTLYRAGKLMQCGDEVRTAQREIEALAKSGDEKILNLLKEPYARLKAAHAKLVAKNIPMDLLKPVPGLDSSR